MTVYVLFVRPTVHSMFWDGVQAYVQGIYGSETLAYDAMFRWLRKQEYREALHKWSIDVQTYSVIS